MNRQRLDSPLVYVGAHNVYYVKLPVKVLYFTIHIHTQINQYVVISDFPPVSVEKYGNKSVPFGAIVTHGENKNGSIVAENGQVYLTGLPQSGKLQVSWGKDKNSNCIVDYKLPVVSPGTLLNQQTAICR